MHLLVKQFFLESIKQFLSEQSSLSVFQQN